jgi:hypothetical protein
MLDIFRTLPGVLDRLEDDGEMRQAIVFAAWRRIAGESLGEHAVPLELEDTRLKVAVSNVTWQRHMKDLCGQMVFKLNAALGAPLVTFVELLVDEEAVLRDRAGRSAANADEERLRRQAEVEITPELRAAAESIEDEDLRKQFLLAAGNCLVRKRRSND